MKYLVGTVILVQTILLGVVVFFFITFNRKLDRLNVTIQKTSAAYSPEPMAVKLDFNPQDPSAGSNSAPVKMVIFSDFECGYCKMFAEETFPKIKSKYVDKGLIEVFYRDLPLDLHSKAFVAAEAGACANDQNKFWEIHDIFFNNETSLDDNFITAAAKKLSLDMNKFNACLKTHKFKSEIEKDMGEAASIGITGTPTIVINGKVVIGSQPYEQFSEIIDNELEKHKN